MSDDTTLNSSSGNPVGLFYGIRVTHDPYDVVRHRLVFTDRKVAVHVYNFLFNFYSKFLTYRPSVDFSETLWTEYGDRLYHGGVSVDGNKMVTFALQNDKAFGTANDEMILHLVGEPKQPRSAWKRFWKANGTWHETPFRIANYSELG